MNTLRNINALPMPTWRRLGVNGTALDIDLPVPSKAAYDHTPLPEGVSRTHEGILKCAEFKSALSSEIAAYIRVHENAGVRFRVKRGEKAEPVFASYILDDTNSIVVDSNVVFAEANSSITLVLSYFSGEDKSGSGGEGFHAGLTRVIAQNCAEVNVVEIQSLRSGAIHFSDFSAVISNGATVKLTRIILGDCNTYAGCYMKLEGDKAVSEADTFYFGSNSQKLDFSYIARHLGKHSVSNQVSQGILMGRADKIMRGTIDFVHGASGARGAEREETLLLSGTARSRSVPVILCGEESVEGSHAASVGKPEEEKLYYMQSRGLSETEAKTLLALALLEGTLKEIPSEETKEAMRETLRTKLR